MEAWQILLPAFVMSGLMVLTHTYLGLHVLARGIIFVDLALAQIAALGASVAFLMGAEAQSLEAQLYAFAATLMAALAFTGLHRIADKTAREVTIGIVYIVSTALSLLILSRSTLGMEELKAIFNGNILWVSWHEILLVAIVYGVLVLLHGLYRKRFYALSFKNQDRLSAQPEQTQPAQVQSGQVQPGKVQSGQAPPLIWEFLFFASFAIVITLAVNIAGILLVFACLIIPGFSASLLVSSFPKRLVLGWLLGSLGSLFGLWLAYVGDLPVGATVVSVFGVLPLVTLILAKLRLS